ncbi:MAG: carbohydrate ABC transporter permease [Lachnospirales bacterium]
MKTNNKKSLMDYVIIIFFSVLVLLTLYPFYNVLIISLSNTVSTATYTPYILPYTIDFTGYSTILNDEKFINALKISIFVTIVGTSINMFLSVTGSYVLSKKDLIGRKFMLSLILFTMLFNGGLIPTYLNIKNLGLIDSVWSMILPTALNTYYLIIMKNYFIGLPESLIEAAKLDGASEWVILRKIILPISKPFMATFVLFYSVERWNEWYNALLYISQSTLVPLQIYLREILISLNTQLTAQAQQMIGTTQMVSSTSVQMAAIIVTALPIICIYPLLQRHFVSGVMVGGLKE